MPGDGHEDTTATWLRRPEQRPWPPFFHGGRQGAAGQLAGQIPITLVYEFQFAEVPGDRVIGCAVEGQFQRAVAVLRSPFLKRRSDAMGESGRVAPPVHREMDVNQATASVKKKVSFGCAFFVPRPA